MRYIALLILGVSGWFGYQKFMAPPSEAVKTYQAFADAIAREEFSEAENLADGAALRYVRKRQLEFKAPALKVFGQTARTFSIKEIAGELKWAKYTVHSEVSENGGKSVSIEATQTSCRLPAKQAAVICRNAVEKRQRATLEHDDQGWWVTSFIEDSDQAS
ncbi:MAG: hypothetical protein J5J00_14010 [Deltaproteobacteria bacterium]|nr:hypothetical protein [Deltaproteobacteria bacterium]